ncbi:MAG: VOC family protein [Planctomycetota bacterium]|nr:VOC family protein [Planctomycetota bacterium]
MNDSEANVPDSGHEVVGVIETSIYVDDMDRSIAFYRDVLDFRCADEEPGRRLTAMWAGPRQVLLICLRGGSVKPIEIRGGLIPAHDGRGPLHVAFGVPEESREVWRNRLAELEVSLTGEVDWSSGGWSLYFEDPDGHVLELKSSDWSGRPI